MAAHPTLHHPSRIQYGDWLIAGALTLTVGFLTALFSLHNGLGVTYDDASFALATRSFSLPDIRPQLPGYYLYVLLLRLITSFTGNAFTAMKYLNLVFSALGSGLLYFLWRKWFPKSLSILLALLVMSNPFVWFYNSNTQIYAFDLFFSVGAVLLGLSSRGIYALPVFFALGMGIRPSSPLLLFPLYLFLWIRRVRNGGASRRWAVLSHLLGVGALLVWLLPMMSAVGGWKTYLNFYKTLYPVEPLNLLQNIYRLSSYSVFIFLPFVIPAPILLRRILRMGHFSIPELLATMKRFSEDVVFSVAEEPLQFSHSGTALPLPTLKRLLFWWIFPPILFFLLFHYSKGYFTICAAGVLGTLPLLLRGSKRIRELLFAMIILQTLVFVLFPYRLPDVRVYQSLRVRDISLGKVWLERTQSHYLMAQSQNRAVENFWGAADRVVNLFREQAGQDSTAYRFILTDPTFPLKSRLLQARYPDIAFASINLYEDDGYILCRGLTIKEMKGLRELFSRSLFVSRREFVQQYLPDFSLENLRYDGDWAIFSFSPGDTDRAVKRYLTLFER